MSILNVLETHGVDYKLHGQHHHVNVNWIGVDCPYCSPGHKAFRMAWSLRRRYFNCWHCGPQRTGETLALLLDVPVDAAIRLARELKAEDDLNPAVRNLKLRGEYKPPAGVGPLPQEHRRYLLRRGFSPRQLIKEWEIEGIGIAPKLPWRIFIPIHDRKGEVVSWTTRSIAKNPPVRYMSAKASQEAVNHKHLLYGEWKVPGHCVVVCEGPTDVWAIGPGAVAVLGMIASPQQIWRIAQYPVRVVCLDSLPDAQARADRLCDQLAPFEGETYRVRLESAKDAADCLQSAAGRAELDWLRTRFLSAEENAVGR